MTKYTKPIFEIVCAAISEGTITYTSVSERLAADYDLNCRPIGMGPELGGLSGLLDRISERESLAIPPLTSIVVNEGGEPSYGAAPVFAMWLRRRPGVGAGAIKEVASLPYGAPPPVWAIRLAQTDTLKFDWSTVLSLTEAAAWIDAPRLRIR